MMTAARMGMPGFNLAVSVPLAVVPGLALLAGRARIWQGKAALSRPVTQV
jgi:hypothetical protein